MFVERTEENCCVDMKRMGLEISPLTWKQEGEDLWGANLRQSLKILAQLISMLLIIAKMRLNNYQIFC
jgi:hypothetical protein